MQQEFKDQCDNCLEFQNLIGYKNKCLCLDCILKILLEEGVINLDGLERIKELSSEVTNKPLLKVVKYLLTREDMNEKYLNEEKTLKQMVNFIKNEVQKTAKDGWNCLEDEEVYSLAIHYWDESNKNLKIENDSEEDDEKIEKPESKKKSQKKEWVAEGQLSLF